MKIFIVLLLTGSVFFCAAQKKTDPVLFANNIQAENLKKLLFIVAGPNFEGRETATRGQQMAAEFIEKKFKEYGLKPGNNGSYQMPYPVYQDSLVSAGIQVNGTDFSLFTDFDIRMAGNHTSSFGCSDIVFAGYGISDSSYDDYAGMDVSGKIVMVLNSYPPDVLQKKIATKTFNPYAKQDAAQRHGAAALFVLQNDFPHRSVPDLGIMYRKYFDSPVRLNTFYISIEIAKALLGNDLERAVRGKLETKTYHADIRCMIQKQTRFLESSDVLGVLEGTDLKDQFLVISAHYDHLGKKDSVIFYGADDDGSGTVSLIEIAAAFAKAKAQGRGTRRSILFLANSGEEKGLWGSEFYTDHPLYPLNNTTADLNIDMIGRKDPTRKSGDSNNYVYVVGDDKLSSELHSINEEANRKYTKLELDYRFNDPKDPLRIYYRSDHYNFARKGVPIIFYFDGIHGDYHKTSDTPDKINYDLMEKRAKLVFYTAWEMANRENMLKRDLAPVSGQR